MRVNLAVHFMINNNKVLRRGSFILKQSDVHTAHEWIRQMQREYPSDLIIEQVIVDNKKDITEEVKKMFEAPPM